MHLWRLTYTVSGRERCEYVQAPDRYEAADAAPLHARNVAVELTAW